MYEADNAPGHALASSGLVYFLFRSRVLKRKGPGIAFSCYMQCDGCHNFKARQSNGGMDAPQLQELYFQGKGKKNFFI